MVVFELSEKSRNTLAFRRDVLDSDTSIGQNTV